MSEIGEISGVKILLSKEQYNKYKGNLQEQLEEKNKEIERLHSIIKEVREDMKEVRERYNYYGSDNFDLSILSFWIEKLEILDKVGDMK